MAAKPKTIDMAYDLYDADNEDERCPIILMHGWYWNRAMFTEIAQKLARSTKRKVYNLDMRSHGESPNPEKKINKVIMTEDLKYFLDSKNIAKASFICHSMSCIFAHMLAIQQPYRVEKLIMIDYHPYRQREEIKGKAANPQIIIPERYLMKLNNESWRSLYEGQQKLLRQPYETNGQRVFLEKLASELIKVNGKFQWSIDMDYLFDRAQSPDLFNYPNPDEIYEGPLLIIRGSESPYVSDAKFEQVLNFNPKSKLVTFTNASHMLHYERMSDFIQTVTEFLNSES